MCIPGPTDIARLLMAICASTAALKNVRVSPMITFSSAVSVRLGPIPVAELSASYLRYPAMPN